MPVFRPDPRTEPGYREDPDYRAPQPQAPARRGGYIGWLIERARRATMTEGLLRPECGICHAASGEPCDEFFHVIAELVLIESDPRAVIHVARAQAAIAAGHVSKYRFLRQFPPGAAPAAFR
jgi:hypothetical protein